MALLARPAGPAEPDSLQSGGGACRTGRRPPGAVAGSWTILGQGGVNVVVRHRKGNRIDAACGQLRRLRGGTSRRDPVAGLGPS